MLLHSPRFSVTVLWYFHVMYTYCENTVVKNILSPDNLVERIDSPASYCLSRRFCRGPSGCRIKAKLEWNDPKWAPNLYTFIYMGKPHMPSRNTSIKYVTINTIGFKLSFSSPHYSVSQRIPATCQYLKIRKCVWKLECVNKDIHMQVFQCLSLSEFQITDSLFFWMVRTHFPLYPSFPAHLYLPCSPQLMLCLLSLPLFACSVCFKLADSLF